MNRFLILIPVTRSRNISHTIDNGCQGKHQRRAHCVFAKAPQQPTLVIPMEAGYGTALAMALGVA